MIILGKSKYVEKMLNDKELGRKPSETLYLIAGYLYNNGLNKGQIRKKLEEFILQAAPDANLLNWETTIEYSINRAKKYPIKDIEYIPVTKKELEIIDGLEGALLKRLAFTLLVLAKYWNYTKGTTDSWVTNDDSEIMRMANIAANLRKQSQLYHTLYLKELVTLSKKVDNTSVRINYLSFDEDDEEILQITDMRNLGYQYLKYTGEPYFVCECCGITTKIKTPRAKKKQKYCPTCAAQIAMKQRIDSVMRSRGKADFKTTVTTT